MPRRRRKPAVVDSLTQAIKRSEEFEKAILATGRVSDASVRVVTSPASANTPCSGGVFQKKADVSDSDVCEMWTEVDLRTVASSEVYYVPSSGSEDEDIEDVTSLVGEKMPIDLVSLGSSIFAKKPRRDARAQCAKFDGPRPKVEGQPPKNDGLRPKVEKQPPKNAGLPPKVEKQPPKADGPRPKVEGQPPKADRQRPKAEKPTGNADVLYSNDGQRPKVHGPRSNADGQRPKAEGPRQPDGPFPSADKLYDGHRPIPDEARPKADNAPTANVLQSRDSPRNRNDLAKAEMEEIGHAEQYGGRAPRGLAADDIRSCFGDSAAASVAGGGYAGKQDAIRASRSQLNAPEDVNPTSATGVGERNATGGKSFAAPLFRSPGKRAMPEVVGVASPKAGVVKEAYKKVVSFFGGLMRSHPEQDDGTDYYSSELGDEWWREPGVQREIRDTIVKMYEGAIRRKSATIYVRQGLIHLQRHSKPSDRPLVKTKKIPLQGMAECHLKYCLEYPEVFRDEHGSTAYFDFYFIPCQCGRFKSEFAHQGEVKGARSSPQLVNPETAGTSKGGASPYASLAAASGSAQKRTPSTALLSDSQMTLVKVPRFEVQKDHYYRHQRWSQTTGDHSTPSASSGLKSMMAPPTSSGSFGLSVVLPNGKERLLTVDSTTSFGKVSSDLAREFGVRNDDVQLHIAPTTCPKNFSDGTRLRLTCVLPPKHGGDTLTFHHCIKIYLQSSAVKRFPFGVYDNCTVDDLARFVRCNFNSGGGQSRFRFFMNGKELDHAATLRQAGVKDECVVDFVQQPLGE